MEAVLARVARLGAGVPRGARSARPSSPSQVEPRPRRPSCSGRRWTTLAEAELAGVIEVRPDSLAFRHELARRAIEQQPAGDPPPAAQRGGRAGAARPAAAGARARSCTTRSRRGDVETIIAVGPAAGPRGRAGRVAPAGARALRVRAPAPATGSALRERARACSTPTAGSSTTRTASARPSTPAARRRRSIEEVGDPVALGDCLVRLSRHLFMAGETDAAEDARASGR